MSKVCAGFRAGVGRGICTSAPRERCPRDARVNAIGEIPPKRLPHPESDRHYGGALVDSNSIQLCEDPHVVAGPDLREWVVGSVARKSSCTLLSRISSWWRMSFWQTGQRSGSQQPSK
jgi:hypothetical protein